jgi:hypothetical protein
MAAPDDTQTAAPPDYPSPQDIQAALAARGVTAAAAAPPPSAAPAAAADPTQDYIRQQLALLQAPLPQIKPDTTPAQGGIVGLLGRIGMALAGGSITDTLSPAQRERAGIRALGDFGTSLMAGSGYYPGKPMFGGLAQGFQGAERSEAGSEQQAASYLGAQQNWQLEQQKLQLERLKEAMPLLQMQYGATIPNPLLAGPAVPGTATGAGKPGGSGVATAPSGATIEPAAFNNATAVRDGLIKRGIDADTATALAANALHESVANPATGRGDKGNSAGLFQWSGPRLQAYTDAYGHPPDGSPLDEQLDFVTRELKGSEASASAQIGQAQGPAAKAAAVSQYYLRPKDTMAEMQRRSATALQLQQQLGGGTGTASAAPSPSGTRFAGPGAPPGSPAAPAAPSTAPDATAPSAAAPAAPGELTFEQFQAQHPIAINAADYTVTPPGLAEARAAQAAAAQQLSLARAGRGGDPNKSLSDYNTATQAVNKLQQDAQAKSLELQQAAQKNALDTQRQLYDAEMQRKQGDEKAAADRAAAVALKTQEGEQAVRLANIQADQQRVTNKEQVTNTANLEGLKTAQKEQADSRDVVAQLAGFRAISDGFGQPGWLQTTKVPGSDKTIAETLGQLGMPLSDTGGVQLLRGGINNLVKTLRQGMAMGSLSDRDLNFIERMGPTEWMDQDTRSAAVGYLQQAYQAKQRFSSDVQKEMSRGKNYGDAMDTADAKQKPFVPAVPADLTAHWTDSSPEWSQRRIQWAQEHEVRPGTLYHLADGKIMVMKSPRALQQGQQ